MIGIFDSGVGGFCACEHLRSLLPSEEIIFLADGKNAPYGTKEPEVIRKITEKNIKILRGAGAELVLIACCTASSLYSGLPPWAREISLPIIDPAARVAAEGAEHIAVIATRHTARTHAFATAIAKYTDAPVTEYAEQELVALVESGSRWGRMSRRTAAYLDAMAERIASLGADTLILGCTHFSHLMRQIGRRLPSVRIISPAHVGAEEIARRLNRKTIGKRKDI